MWDDETLRIVNRAALSSLETYFMDKRRDSVHLKQRLDVFFVHEAGFGNLELMEALVLLANPWLGAAALDEAESETAATSEQYIDAVVEREFLSRLQLLLEYLLGPFFPFAII